MYYVYVLESYKNKKRYIGFTSKDLNQRLAWHLSGSSPWTKQNSPFGLIYFEHHSSKSAAIRREGFFKTGNGRKTLENLIGAHSSVG